MCELVVMTRRTTLTGRFFLICFVYADGAAVKFFAVHTGNRGCSSCIIGKCNKTEAPGTSRFTVRNDFGICHFTELSESPVQSFRCRCPGQTTNKKLLRHSRLSQPGVTLHYTRNADRKTPRHQLPPNGARKQNVYFGLNICNSVYTPLWIFPQHTI